MLQNTLNQLRANVGRVSAAALAIVLGVAFVAATLVFTGTLESSTSRAVAAPELAADLVVGTESESFRTGDAQKVGQVPGVAVSQFRYNDNAETFWNGGSGYSSVFVVPPDPRLQWFSLAEGRLPGAGNEVALDSVAARGAGLGVGGTITARTLSYGTGEVQTEFRVTGLVDTGRTLVTGGSTPSLFAAPAKLEELGLVSVGGIDVLVDEGADVETVRSAIGEAMGPGFSVKTGEQRAKEAADQLGPMSAVINAMLLPFSAIALFVAGFVIVNTFSVLFAQRSRQYALLRCVGASRSQIRGSALLEALIIGAVASVVGTAFGVFVAAVVGWPLGLTKSAVDFGSLGITAASLLVPPVVGVLVTLLAALAPAGRATRVSPLAALRPVVETSVARRMGRVRLVFALVLTVIGLALLLAGAFGGSLAMAVPGALLAAIGVLLWTPSLIPAVATLFGGLFRFAGPTGVLATGNAVRNPYRAASTSTALMIGVGLIVTLLTGTATAQETATARVDERFPVDAMVMSETGALPPEVVQKARNLDGVAAAMELRAADVEIDYSSHRVFGADPAKFRDIARHGGDALKPGTALMNPTDLEYSDVKAGEQLRIPARDGGTVAVRLVASDLAQDDQIVLAESDLAKIAPDTQVSAVWLRADDSVDTKVFVDNLSGFYSGSGGGSVQLSGAAPMRAQIGTVLDIMLSVVTGLLGVAVIIAVVGIANTLGLSVLERGRESALLRALGLTRGQLRGTLAFEAVLLALVGALLGAVLGVLFAWAGATALFGQLGFESSFHVPFGRLLLVLGCAVLAGVLASVLPARRAAKAAPAEALSDE
ncbi:ABC transporter permease [Saccharopolyspora erythraea]|uniref:ABC transporter permease n=1 Tax=Saccharopolyspora erythraea TaxID=1836 RepID=UPI001BA6C190|nr:ABC transporter permease [Saccharopolyspora erythraea]QUH03311.1 ABC transporter permease [Saccharopolyspora erythraea]